MLYTHTHTHNEAITYTSHIHFFLYRRRPPIIGWDFKRANRMGSIRACTTTRAPQNHVVVKCDAHKCGRVSKPFRKKNTYRSEFLAPIVRLCEFVILTDFSAIC